MGQLPSTANKKTRDDPALILPKSSNSSFWWKQSIKSRSSAVCIQYEEQDYSDSSSSSIFSVDVSKIRKAAEKHLSVSQQNFDDDSSGESDSIFSVDNSKIRRGAVKKKPTERSDSSSRGSSSSDVSERFLYLTDDADDEEVVAEFLTDDTDEEDTACDRLQDGICSLSFGEKNYGGWNSGERDYEVRSERSEASSESSRALTSTTNQSSVGLQSEKSSATEEEDENSNEASENQSEERSPFEESERSFRLASSMESNDAITERTRNSSDNAPDTFARSFVTVRRSTRAPIVEDSDGSEYQPSACVRRSINASLRRAPSTRPEAKNAAVRISLCALAMMTSSSSEQSVEEGSELFLREPIVNLEDISLDSGSGFGSSSSGCVSVKRDLDSLRAENIPCTICKEERAVKPVKAICCGQNIGCKSCVKLWYKTTNISHLNAASPLSRGQNHRNHTSCPLCREEWPSNMLISNCY